MIDWMVANPQAASLIFTAVVALSTVVYAGLTALLVIETRSMRKIQTEPRIVVLVETSPDHINFGFLFVRNLGMGPAQKLRFSVDALTPGQGAELLLKDFVRSTNFFSTGVEFLGPGAELRSKHTAFTESSVEKLDAKLRVRVTYRGSKPRDITDEFVIDMSEFKGKSNFGRPHMYTIANSLEKIQKDLSKIVKGNRVQLDSYSSKDRRRREKELDKMYESGNGLASKLKKNPYLSKLKAKFRK